MTYHVGIDVSKDKLDNLWLRDPELGKVKSKVIENTPKGHHQLAAWLRKTLKAEPAEVHVVMEATGVYHEAVALYLFEQGFRVSVVNPALIKHFAKGTGSVHKTDKRDSWVLAKYSHQERPALWQPEPLEIRELKGLLARLQAVENDLQRELNRLEKAEIAQAPDEVMRSLDNMIHALKEEKARLKQQIDDHIDKHPKLKKNRRLLESVPAVGPVVSRIMLAVLGSRRFTNAGQVAAFLGLIPRLCESGTLKGRSVLSKQGSGSIRAKLYLPAVTATRTNPDIRAQYQRLLKNGKTKMQAIGAAMRKLVQICFGVVKHQSEYRPQHVCLGS